MAPVIFHIIAYVQIMSAGFNLWGVDPLILFNMPVGRNMFLVGLFMLVQLLGLSGAILILQNMRLGFILSLVHHVLLLPALVITGWGLVMLMDDRINASLLFMSKPTGSEVALYWSLGWSTVFKQVTPNVPAGSTCIGINLFAAACAYVLWREVAQMAAEDAERAREARRRRRQGQRPPQKQLALPYYPPQQAQPQQQYPQRQRMPPPQAARQQQQRRAPRREY